MYGVFEEIDDVGQETVVSRWVGYKKRRKLMDRRKIIKQDW